LVARHALRLLACILMFSGLAAPTSADVSSETYELLFVGDIMIQSGFAESGDPNCSVSQLDDELVEYIASADLAFGNLEGAVAPGPVRDPDCSGCFRFGISESTITMLSSIGFDAFSIANNHSNDFGTEGIDLTIDTLIRSGIRFSGTTRPGEQTATIELSGGATLGFAAFSTSPLSIDMNHIEQAESVVNSLSDHDLIVVSFHGGREGRYAYSLTGEAEFFLGQNRGNPIEFARRMVDAGADIVFGHGPHVPRGMEVYNDKLIAYSLGNFWTCGNISSFGLFGIAPMLRVRINAAGTLEDFDLVSSRQAGLGHPELDFREEALRFVFWRSKQDLENAYDLLVDRWSGWSLSTSKPLGMLNPLRMGDGENQTTPHIILGPAN
jgi:hypothetical protein